MADAHARHAVDLERDEHAIERHATDEGLRAVDWIEHPPVRGPPVVLPVFLAQHGVPREPRSNQLAQNRFGAPVGDGDRGSIRLELDVHAGLEMCKRALPGNPRGMSGEFQIRGQGRRSAPGSRLPGSRLQAAFLAPAALQAAPRRGTEPTPQACSLSLEPGAIHLKHPRRFRNCHSIVPWLGCAEVEAVGAREDGLAEAELAAAGGSTLSWWPSAVSAVRVASGTSASICTSQPVKVVFVNRPASSASCGVRPKSAMSATNCACACAWFHPPMIPNAMRVPSFSMKPGMIVWSGRLRGASVFGWFGSSVNSAPRFCSMKPAPSGTTPDPNPE